MAHVPSSMRSLRALSLSLACSAVLAIAAGVGCGGDDGHCSDIEPSSLLQVSAKGNNKAALHTSADTGTCSKLKNQGSHFTVNIAVGTPPQKFDVVADTGSNAVIVASCLCQKSGLCSKSDKCFTGTDHSSSFVNPAMKKLADGRVAASVVSMTFGSGTIESAVATDLVSVGGHSVTMNQSLLLMVGRRLRIAGPFEGILGLGLPGSHLGQRSDNETSALEFKEHPDPRMTSRRIPIGSHDADVRGAGVRKPVKALMATSGFLEQAKIARFAICMNSSKDGVLRLSQPTKSNLMSNVGKAHWSVELSGLSVGDASAPSSLCSRSTMHPGQTTPCAAIPDSGTTVMMAPPSHLISLFSDLCTRWPRCMEKAKFIQKDLAEGTSEEAKGMQQVLGRLKDFSHHLGKKPPKMKFDLAKDPKILSMLFQKLLLTCNDFVNASHGLDQELPPLHFHLAGANGKKQTLKLAGADYIFEMMENDIKHVKKNLFGVFPVDIIVENKSAPKKRVCSPAFGSMNMNTTLNGPVWILGLPIFFKFQVGYELTTTPPSMSFTEEVCGTCSDTATYLQASTSVAGQHPLQALAQESPVIRQPQFVSGPHRLPTNIDVNGQL